MARLPPRDFFTLFRRWKADAAVRLGPATIKQYRRYLIATAAEIGKDPCQMSSKELKQYLGTLRSQYGQQTRNALQDFYGFMVRKGFIDHNPVASVAVKVRGRKRMKRGLTLEELTRLLVAAVCIHGERFAFQILAQYGTGLRPGEMCKLPASKVHLNGSTSCVYVGDTKTGNDRIVPLGAVAREAFAELMDGREGSLVGVGTSRYWELVRAAAKYAGLPDEKCRPYALRHTAATHMIERGVPARFVAEILGHSDMRSIYPYTVPSDENLRAAVESLG